MSNDQATLCDLRLMEFKSQNIHLLKRVNELEIDVKVNKKIATVTRELAETLEKENIKYRDALEDIRSYLLSTDEEYPSILLTVTESGLRGCADDL